MLASSFDWDMIFSMPNLVFVVGCVIAVVAIIAGSWTSVLRQRSSDDLKLTLVERGLSADQIEKIVRARPKSHCENDES